MIPVDVSITANPHKELHKQCFPKYVYTASLQWVSPRLSLRIADTKHPISSEGHLQNGEANARGPRDPMDSKRERCLMGFTLIGVRSTCRDWKVVRSSVLQLEILPNQM